MWLKDEIVKLIDFRQIQGTKGEFEYNFPSVTIGDDEFNKFTVNVGRDDLVDEKTLPDWVLKLIESKGEIAVDIKIFPNKDDKYGQTSKMEIHNLRKA
jgi:hypothetical protein